MLSVVLATNLGALFGVLGALAGIVWMRILRAKGVQLSALAFSGYGAMFATAPALLALALLALELHLFGEGVALQNAG